MENILSCINLGEMKEHLALVKTEKAPETKKNIAEFISRAIKITYIDTLEEIYETIGPLGVTVSDEKDGVIREKGLVILGTLLARVPATSKYVEPMIDQKKTKINAHKDAYTITKYDKSEKKAAAAAAVAAKKAAATAKAKPAPKKAAAMNFGNDDEEMKNDSPMKGDVLDEVAPKKPLAKKPALGARKPAAAAAADEDALAQPDPPKRGPPARLAAKAAPSSSGPAKVVKADDIQEEDLGSGMSKE